MSTTCHQEETRMLLSTDEAYLPGEEVPPGYDWMEFTASQLESGWDHNSFEFYAPMVGLLKFLEESEDLMVGRHLVKEVGKLAICAKYQHYMVHHLDNLLVVALVIVKMVQLAMSEGRSLPIVYECFQQTLNQLVLRVRPSEVADPGQHLKKLLHHCNTPEFMDSLTRNLVAENDVDALLYHSETEILLPADS